MPLIRFSFLLSLLFERRRRASLPPFDPVILCSIRHGVHERERGRERERGGGGRVEIVRERKIYINRGEFRRLGKFRKVLKVLSHKSNFMVVAPRKIKAK